MIDPCTTCRCTVQVGAISGFKLECRKITCEACPLVREGLSGTHGMDWYLWDPSNRTSLGSLNKAFMIFWLLTIFDNGNEQTKSHPPKLCLSEIIII